MVGERGWRHIVDVAQLSFHSLDIVIGLTDLLFGEPAIAQASRELPLLDSEGHERGVALDTIQKVEILLTGDGSGGIHTGGVDGDDETSSFAAALLCPHQESSWPGRMELT